MSTKEIHQTITFESVINLERSSGLQRISDNSVSNIEIVTRANGSGWFEWDVPDLEITESGCLEFDGMTLTGYDGVMSLPDEIMDFLESEGFDCSECR